MSSSNIKKGRVAAFIAVALLEIATIVELCLFFGLIAGERPKRDADTSFFDVEFLTKLWAWRRKGFSAILAVDFLLSIGVLALAYASSILSRSYKSLEGISWRVMYLCFFFGALVPAIGFLQNLGSFSVGDNYSKVLYSSREIVNIEISYILTGARSVWLEAMIYIFLAIGLMISCFLAFAKKDNSKAVKWHAVYGLIVGIFGFIVFGLDVARFFFPNLSKSYAVCSLFYTGFGLGIWTMWLGFNFSKIDLTDHHQYIAFQNDFEKEDEIEMDVKQENKVEINDRDDDDEEEEEVDDNIKLDDEKNMSEINLDN